MTSQLIGGGGEMGKETDKEKEAEKDREEEEETPKLMYDVNSNPPADIIIIYAIQVIAYIIYYLTQEVVRRAYFHGRDIYFAIKYFSECTYPLALEVYNRLFVDIFY